MWWFILILIVWTLASAAWFVVLLGDKFRTNKWYDYVLCPPILLICTILGALTK